VRVVYYDHERADEGQCGFRRGHAGWVKPGADGVYEVEDRVCVPPNALHALYAHGVVAELNRLPLEVGPIAPGRDAVLRPVALDDASRVLYEADRRTYGRTWEFVVDERAGPEPLQFRIVIDNREYQRTLSQLQYLVTLGGRSGFGVRLRL
jgi:hypothetical protein